MSAMFYTNSHKASSAYGPTAAATAACNGGGPRQQQWSGGSSIGGPMAGLPTTASAPRTQTTRTSGGGGFTVRASAPSALKQLPSSSSSSLSPFAYPHQSPSSPFTSIPAKARVSSTVNTLGEGVGMMKGIGGPLGGLAIPATSSSPSQILPQYPTAGTSSSLVGNDALEAQKEILQEQLRQIQLQMELQQLKALQALQEQRLEEQYQQHQAHHTHVASNVAQRFLPSEHAYPHAAHRQAAPAYSTAVRAQALGPQTPYYGAAQHHTHQQYTLGAGGDVVTIPPATLGLAGPTGVPYGVAMTTPPYRAHGHSNPSHVHPLGGGNAQSIRPPVDVSLWGYAVCDSHHPFLQRVPIPPSVCAVTKGMLNYNNDVQASSTKPCGSTVCVAYGGKDGVACPFGESCPHFHVDRDYLTKARTVLEPLCCAYHNDYFSREIVASDTNPALVSHRYALLLEDKSGIEISPAYLAFTVGLDNLPTKGRGSAACKYISVRKHLCRLHLEGKCKWTKDCSHVHICREVYRHVLGTPRQELMNVLSITDTPAPVITDRLVNTPSYISYIRSPAALPLVSWVLEGLGHGRSTILEAIIAAGALFSEDQASVAKEVFGYDVPSKQIAAVPTMLRRFFKPKGVAPPAGTAKSISTMTSDEDKAKTAELYSSTISGENSNSADSQALAPSTFVPKFEFSPFLGSITPYPQRQPSSLEHSNVSKTLTPPYFEHTSTTAGGISSTVTNTSTSSASVPPTGISSWLGSGGFGSAAYAADDDEGPSPHELLGSLLFLTKD